MQLSNGKYGSSSVMDASRQQEIDQMAKSRKVNVDCLFLSNMLPLFFCDEMPRSRETGVIIRACDSKSLSLVTWSSPVIADVTGCHSLKAAAVYGDGSLNLVGGHCDGH